MLVEISKSEYQRLHKWVRENKPKPDDGLCEKCHKNPCIGVNNISQKYLWNLDDFYWGCQSCNVLDSYVAGAYDVEERNCVLCGVDPSKKLLKILEEDDTLYFIFEGLCENCYIDILDKLYSGEYEQLDKIRQKYIQNRKEIAEGLME